MKERTIGDAGHATVGALRQALPYLRLYQGRTFVVKVGGAIFDRPAELRGFLEQVGVLHRMGIRVVLVHGGGPQISREAEAAGLATPRHAGRRVTSPEVLRVAAMVLNGELNTKAVALLRGLGVGAVGLSGVDAGLFVARRRPPVEIDGEVIDFGEVGDPEVIDPGIILTLLAAGQLPVLSPLAADAEGCCLNVNADTVAARLAVELGAEKLLVATSAPGIMEDVDDPSSLHSWLDLEDVEELAGRGVLADGMLPKTAAARLALEGGVAKVHVISCVAPDALLAEVFTNAGSGTLLVRTKEKTVDV